MKTSIATVSISGELPEKLAAIAAAGFDAVEIFENDLLASDISPREVGRMVRDAGLEISLFQPFRDFEGLPEPQRRRAFDRAERKFDVMQELGTDLMLVCSTVSPAALGGIDRAAGDFRDLGERAHARGLKVGYEALAWGRHVSDHRDAWEIVRRADHPSVGLILDSFHTLARRIDLGSIRSIPKDRIFIVQVADAPLIDMDLLYWSRHFRNMPGEGDLRVVDFMRAVAATGYDGTVSLEIFNDRFRGGSPGRIAADGHRSLVHLADEVRRQEPGLAPPDPAMPPRISIEGVEFVEFTADVDGAARLESLFRTLGFRRARRHVSKDVAVFSQGAINLVVNTEAQGFARSAFVTHGTSVCAMALRVDDASATVARARALGAQTFAQRPGPGELDIPAIRGVGGSVVYFVDAASDLGSLWNIDFVAQDDDEDVLETGLTSIDHIGQTMDQDEMPSWVLFYTSIFRTLKTPLFDVIDPAGVVRSQAVESDDGRFRLTLNGAENSRTLAGHFLGENFGSGLQHLAFATSDIFATAATLRSHGFDPLPISRNYFDDVEARFGLDPAFADQLREENILYDRDEKGEFLQLYAPTFGAGLIFEIVERRGGYQGYGAANSSFRIAAQKRYLRLPMHGSM
jgi:4-hydroxyphenylpyruvate dioxygenase